MMIVKGVSLVKYWRWKLDWVWLRGKLGREEIEVMDGY